VNSLSTVSLKEDNPLKTLLNKLNHIWLLIGFEASVWILSLAYLILIHSPEETHFTICPLANMGFNFCPGCGLGNSISYIFQGEFVASFHSHPLGIFALLIISFRIFTIIKNNRRRYA
jgi:lipoprotein signal peptidase